MKATSIVYLLFIKLLVSFSAYSQTNTWTPIVLSAPGEFSFNNPSNWSLGIVPTASHSVVMNFNNIGGLGLGYTVRFPATVSITNLTISVKANLNFRIAPITGSTVTFNCTGLINISNDVGITGRIVNHASLTQLNLTSTAATANQFTRVHIDCPLTINVPVINTSSCTFYQTLSTTVTSTVAANQSYMSSTVYKGISEFIHTGAAHLNLANSGNSTFENEVRIVNTSTATSDIRVGDAGITTFMNKITFESYVARNIFLGANSSSKILLNSVASLFTDATRFTNGSINIYRIKQDIANNTVNSLTSNSLTTTVLIETIINTPPSSDNEIGPVTIRAGSVFTNNVYYRGFASLEKLINSGITLSGGNTFNAGAELINSGSGGFTFTNSSQDIVRNGNLTLITKSSGGITIGFGNIFSITGDIIIGSTSTGSITLGNTSMINGRVQQELNPINQTNYIIIEHPTLGFNNNTAFLNFERFIQNESLSPITDVNLLDDITKYTRPCVLDLGANIRVGTHNTASNTIKILMEVNWISNNLVLNAGEFFNRSYFTNTGTSSGLSGVGSLLKFYRDVDVINSGTGSFTFGMQPMTGNGQIIFDNKVNIIMSSTGRGSITLGRYCNVIINGDLNITTRSACGSINIGAPGAVISNPPCLESNRTITLNGNITLNKIGMGSAGNIDFGNNSLVKHNGQKNINVGTWGFGGVVNFNNFQQDTIGVGGNINLTFPSPLEGSVDDITSNYTLVIFNNGNVYGGKLIAIANSIRLLGGTFDEIATFTKLKGSNEQTNVAGATFIFKKNVTFIHSGSSGVWDLIARGSTEIATFMDNVFINRNHPTGAILNFGIAGNIYFHKNLEVQSASVPTFGSTGGIIHFVECKPQTIYSSTTLTIPRLRIDKTCEDVTVNTNLTIASYADFTKGRLIVPRDAGGNYTKLITFTNTAVAQNASINSFVDGKVRKIGTTTGAVGFNFPIGDGTIYMPLRITELCSTTSNVEATYFHKPQTFGTVLNTGVADISNCNYWNITQTSGTCSFSVTAPWTSQTCHTVNKDVMFVSLWSASKWNNNGGNNRTGDNIVGTVTSNAATNFGNITLGFATALVLDTRKTNMANFTIGQGADHFVSTFSSTITPAGTQTLLASQNNIPGQIVLHPDLNLSCVEVNIQSTSNDRTNLNLCLITNGSGTVTGVSTSGKTVSSDYYTVNGNKISFYATKKEDEAAIIITTNLMNGMVINQPDLQFNIANNQFAYTNLQIINAANQSVFNGTLNYSGNNAIYPNANALSPGTYRYTLSIGTSAATAVTYSGYMVKQ